MPQQRRRPAWLTPINVAIAVLSVVVVVLGAMYLFGGSDGAETAVGASPSTTSLATAAGETTATTSEGTTGAAVLAGAGETPGEVFLEPVGSLGPDPFTGEVFADPVDPAAAPALEPTPQPAAEADTAAVEVQGTNGDTPGLYGGTRDDARCDADGILAFLQANPDKAAAWVEALDADPTLAWDDGRTDLTVADLPAYFAELTPVLLTEDTRVTNHGFRDGEPTARQSVFQAGTAVLVDVWGVPRVRCACGNPLTPPRPSPTAPTYVGPPWPGWGTTIIIVVQPSVVIVDGFVLVDVFTGDVFERPAGTSGAADADSSVGLPQDGVVVVAGPGAYPPTDGVPGDTAYDSALFTAYIDPATTDWIAFSGAGALVDQPAGDADRVTDGILDIIFPDVDDFLVVVATVNGVDSGPYVIHDRDAFGTPIGPQAVIYGYHPSVWYVSEIDWSTDPPFSYTATGPETGDMTSFIDAQGAGEYRFDVTFYNKWTGWVAHGPLYLLVGSAVS